MAIDLATLKATTFGDPETKLSVKRSWLKEVHKLLIEGASYRQRYDDLVKTLAAQGIQVSTTTISPEARRDLEEGVDQVDRGMNKIFGQGGAFDKVFGKKRRDG